MLGALKRALGADDSRSLTRLRVNLQVRLAPADIPVTIVNISNAGAKVASDVAPTPGQSVEILWHDKAIAAKVHWSKARHFGITFDQPLSNNRLTAMLSDGLEP